MTVVVVAVVVVVVVSFGDLVAAIKNKLLRFWGMVIKIKE